MEKADIRRQMRAARRALTADQRQQMSAAVADRLEQLPQFARARVVLMYWSMDDEVQTHTLVERHHLSKTVLLPCVDGENLRLRQYTGSQCLVAGEQFGIGEPSGPEWTDLGAVDLVVVPGVAFDRRGNRMGRGRGFYDRLLRSLPSAFKVGVGFAFQLLDAIPAEAHDVPMDCILCGGEPAVVPHPAPLPRG